MPQEIKGIVRPPMRMPDELANQRLAASKASQRKTEVPLLIRLFAWFCALRASIYLVFALIEGLAPDSGAAEFITARFDTWPKQASPEIVFYILTILYGMVAWRWFRRDWRARWGAMFISGATAARTIVDILADRAAGTVTITPEILHLLIIGILFNLLICAYLAFYPGMEQSFSETPWR